MASEKTIKQTRTRHYCFQIGIAMLLMFISLSALDYFTNIEILGAVGATSLAASCFIAFAAPHSKVAHPLHMISSYFIATIIGVVCFNILQSLIHQQPYIGSIFNHEFVGALAVGLAFIVMLSLHIEHPPAVGFTLGLVLEQWDFWTLTVILSSIIIIALVKTVLRPYLKPLY